jgi:hypothetical protein
MRDAMYWIKEFAESPNRTLTEMEIIVKNEATTLKTHRVSEDCLSLLKSNAVVVWADAYELEAIPNARV